jgi:O-antigen ligase
MFGLGITQYIPYITYYAYIVIVFVALLYKPEYGFYLTVLLIPLQDVTDKLVNFPFGKDIFDVLIISTLLGYYIHRKQNEAAVRDRSLNTTILLLVLTSYSAIWVGCFKLGLPYPITFDNSQLVEWKNFAMMPLLYFLTLYTIKDRKQLIIVFGLILVTITLMDIYFYNTARWYSFDHYDQDYRSKLGSTYTYLGPNELASFYVNSAMLIVGALIMDKSLIRRGIYFVIVAFNFYCILFLFSRGGYAAAMAGIIFYGIAKKRVLILLLIVLLIGWKVILPGAVVERIEMTKTEEGVDHSVLARFELWSEALEVIASNPISGIGFGGTKYLGFKKSERKANRKDVHNGYLEVLMEQGFLGLFLILNLFIIGIKRGWALHRKTDDYFMSGIGIGFVGMTIASLAANFFGDKWSYFSLMGYNWIVLGMVIRAMDITRREKESLPATS